MTKILFTYQIQCHPCHAELDRYIWKSYCSVTQRQRDRAAGHSQIIRLMSKLITACHDIVSPYL